jgi:hypothetical protein
VQQVDISPPTNVYATFGRLNYTPWHAISEFVDNATQNYFAHRGRRKHSPLGVLTVQIEHRHKESLIIRDNALGMSLDVLTRAFRLSSPPADTSGRSEFGMGLKTAACWFGTLWTISTTPLGERWRYTCVFDVDAISKSGQSKIDITREPADEDEHGTTLTLERLARPVAGRQIEKTKRLLGSIYRRDLASGAVRILWNGQPLDHSEPELMRWEVDDEIVPCRVDIDCEVTDPLSDKTHRVKGWVGSLQKMSQQDSGLALLRRGRMIIGGPGDNWRPLEIVGSLNSHSGKRLVGELELDTFPVNFTKDGFAWDGGLQDELIVQLAPLLDEVRAFSNNARVSKKAVEPADFVRAVDEVQRGLDHPVYVEAVSGARDVSSHEVRPRSVGDSSVAVSRAVPQELVIPMGTGQMRARLVLVDGGPQEAWLTIDTEGDDDAAFLVKLNTGNRFVAQHLEDENERTLVAKFALAVATAEAQAKLIFGEAVPPEELREFLNLTLDHSASV